MKLLLIQLLLAVSFTTANADNYTASMSSKKAPIAVIIEREPMQFIINSESPRIVLYDDGTIIFLDTHQIEKFSYQTIMLNSLTFQKLAKSLGPSSDLLSLKSYYAIAEYYDAPSVDLYISDGQISKGVSLYGVAIKNDSLISATHNKRGGGGIPKEIKRIYNLLKKIPKNNSKIWHPDYIEIIMLAQDNSSKQPIPWPDNWPSINDPLSKKNDDSSYSIFLPFSKKAELDSFFKKLKKEHSVVQMDNKKWSIMLCKPAFPNEKIWQEAFK